MRFSEWSFRLRCFMAIIFSFIFRFKTLVVAEHLFGKLPSQYLVSRKLFGHIFSVNISRSTTCGLLYLEGERFVAERGLLRQLMTPGMTVVDVGANIGYYLLLIEQSIGAQGRVICIEPSSENLPELKRNIELNGFKNVKVHEAAVGMEDGATGLKGGINSGVVKTGEGAYEVPLRRLDSLINERVDFLKIDIEGYEGQALRGSRNILEKSRPFLFIELHPPMIKRFGFTVRGIIDELSGLYKEIAFYENRVRCEGKLVAKVAARYLPGRGVRTIGNIRNYADRCDSGSVADAFWMVCRP